MSVIPEALHAQTASVQLFLMAQLGDNLAWQLRLLTCSCSASLIPIKVCLQIELHRNELSGEVLVKSGVAGIRSPVFSNVRPCKRPHHSAH